MSRSISHPLINSSSRSKERPNSRITGWNSRLTTKFGDPPSQARRTSARHSFKRSRRTSTGTDSSSATSSTSRQNAYSADIASRFGRGSSTNARARFEALFLVMAWLSCTVKAREEPRRPIAVAASRQSRQAWDCAGVLFVCGDGAAGRFRRRAGSCDGSRRRARRSRQWRSRCRSSSGLRIKTAQMITATTTARRAQ